MPKQRIVSEIPKSALEVEQLVDSLIPPSNENFVGKAQCGCVYHAEDGIPCEHDLGYAAGRAGKPIPKGASDEFRAGWAQGDSAADESSNSHQTWGR